ncbi:MAG TPA: NYN domain-containing protein [Ktedonobacterales bacterium]
MQDEIALFIDFENIRYSLLNVQRREPDPQELIAIARRFGTVMVARAYADWTRQPEFFKGSLTAAMIDRVDCPAKVRERVRPTQSYYQQSQGYDRPQWRDPNDARDYPYEAEDDEEDDEEVAADEDTSDVPEDQADTREDEGDGADQPESDEQYGSDDADTDETSGEPEAGRRQEQYSYQGQQYYSGNNNSGQQTSTIITQSTVDLNMLMDIIETVFDRPNINTFVLMTGDRDFTRISARLKLRLNKRVIVCGVPGTVSRDLISAAEQFIPLSYGAVAPSSGQYGSQQQNPIGPYTPGQGGYHRAYTSPGGQSYGSGQTYGGQGYGQGYGYGQNAGASNYGATFAPVEPEEPGFIQFLDYIDRHWSWRTIGGVANFIGDPYNTKNRFRGRLTRDTARELLINCIEQGILEDEPDNMGNHNLRLNREHPKVASVLADLSMQ